MNGMTFNPMYQNPYPQMPNNQFMMKPPTASINSINNINWVQGIEGAKAWQLPPNSNAVLLDSEQDRMYIKTSDNIGMCNLRTFNFSEITDQTQSKPTIDMSNYVTRDELNSIILNIIGGKQNEQPIQPAKSSTESNSEQLKINNITG